MLDGINEHSVCEPFQIGKELGISADSIMTGSGGGLMQANIDRDTCKFAFKASNVTRAGVDYPIAKDPITDPGKASKKGKFSIIAEGGYLVCKPREGFVAWDIMRTIYKNGDLKVDDNFDMIRSRSNGVMV